MWAPSQGRTINLFSLARSSAAGQGVLVLLDRLDPLHRLQPFEHGVAVQVIDLALLANNLLRGADLNAFIRRSVSLL